MPSLEDLTLSFLRQLADALPSPHRPLDTSKRASGKKIFMGLADRRKEYTAGNAPMRTLAMPQRSRGVSARPFAQLFKTVDLMHEALLDQVPTTKRDMYYKDVELFGSQSTVDRLVDDLAATLQLSRSDLSVRASAKGLVCGSGLRIHLHSGETVELSDSEPVLIPLSEDIEQFDVDEGLAWVLVVEKEAVFQTLCRLRLGTHPLLPGKGLVITGKGYPDVATRQLLNALSANLPPHIPILCLVDGDAYGIDILSVYKFGSTSMQHEKDQLAAARIQWLGLWSSELAALGIPKDALIPITKHDEKKARSLLKREGIPSDWRKELQRMLFTRRKAEIEVLSSARSTADCVADLALNRHGYSGEPSNPGIPLLRYLLAKISAACGEPRPVNP
ncbi:DNA topoisomerase IV alpha subunit [Trametes versicolor FP-101664 SS1]|uniref:DNA topoisomerase IV alpha subunit n=1 Tax=Trametes versicolor (strain FP-101664) TaxID=717944 RepID=UPI0004622FCF|nr:DNA topoisomerase IV alpha subunit [Trametes versicolor FP-101664 SS1]EIW63071.1 DNA topoisomerase IV alpha subunit [Trametes versicolor FP-101664 SS1]